jgi:hypothetical protein
MKGQDMEHASKDPPMTAPGPRAQVDIYLVGAGIAFPDHLTIETIELLGRCERICTNLPDAMFANLPDDLREKCVGLSSLYQDGRLRTHNYHDVFQAVVEMAEIKPPVAWLTPGHPVIFDSVSAALLKEGRARGWSVRVVPAISCIDTLCAELGYDPAHGLLIHECTGLVRRRIPFVPSVALMLLQPAVFNVDTAIIAPTTEGPDLSPLRDYLCEVHAPAHPCALIRSASQVDQQDLVNWMPLHDLALAPYRIVAGSTLFVPPAGLR